MVAVAEEKKIEVVEILVPGVVVPMPSLGCQAIVYPLGVRQMKRFGAIFSNALSALASVFVVKGKSKEELANDTLKQLVPFVLTYALDIVTDCVRFQLPDGTPVKLKRPDGTVVDLKLDDVPHWEAAPVVSVWLLESFGEEKKWRPWVQAIEDLMSKVTGKPFSTKEMFSKDSSPADTASSTSPSVSS